MSPDNFTQDQFVKKEWLFANVTIVGSPDRGERDTYFQDDFKDFWLIQATFVVGRHFVM